MNAERYRHLIMALIGGITNENLLRTIYLFVKRFLREEGR